MTDAAGYVPPGRRVPTARQRYLAANIRIRADKALKQPTPDWIVEIAERGAERFAS